MQRTTPIVKQEFENGYPIGFLPPGGFLPKPPIDCKHTERAIKEMGIKCIDFGICQSTCKEAKKCQRRKEWMQNKYGEYNHLLYNWKKLHPGK